MQRARAEVPRRSARSCATSSPTAASARASSPRKRCATCARRWGSPMTSVEAALDLEHPSPDAEAVRARLRRAVQRAAARPLHPARGARGLPRDVRGAARPAALPHPQAEHQRARHPDGRADAPVSGLRRDDAPHAARARRRVSADGGGADRDQVAAAAAEAAGAAGRGSRRTRAPSSCAACSSTSG